jgi:tRNA pseudouridine55 synthase
LVVVDKPAAWTSHDVVAKLRKVYRQRRVGHAGTLDPDATGVLLVGLGRATRLLRFLQDTGKGYRATIVFGVSTTTLDASGEVVDRRPMPIDRGDIEAVVPAFLGEIEQLPPMVSAVKVGGRRLHELARRGEEVERAPRRVRVDRIDVEEFEPGPYPAATVLVECSSGTYVRSLAADIGGRLGGVAHLGELRRLHVGSFTLDEARTLADIEKDPDAAVLTPAVAMRDLEQVGIDAEQARAVAHGVTFPAAVFAGANAGPGPFAVLGPDGELLAVYERRRAAVKPAVVLAPVEAT